MAFSHDFEGEHVIGPILSIAVLVSDEGLDELLIKSERIFD